MGLFNRGSKPDMPTDDHEQSTNGHVPERDPSPPSPPPLDPEPDVAEGASVLEEPTRPHEVPVDEGPVERQPQPSPTPPPVNRVEADSGDDERISASEALAPSRQAASGKLLGAHIGDASERRAQIISFANQKGGVAKTTTTLNLAVAFEESGHDVLAIDLDPQGNLTMSQGIDPDKVETSMYDVLVDHIPIREVIRDREIDIAVASIDLAGAEIAMSMQIGRERSLEKALAAVIDDYDFICIDTPPSLGLLTVNALTASDKVIVPVQCE
jgi:Mrp family chromosome partitioning ATPase